MRKEKAPIANTPRSAPVLPQNGTPRRACLPVRSAWFMRLRHIAHVLALYALVLAPQ